MPSPVEFKYRAFLSYAHADVRWGKWLHGRLEGFRIDKDLAGRETAMGQVPKSLRPIFRDREDFSGGHTLTDATIAALDQSAALIVVCSPVAAARPAVNEEVRLFRSRHPGRPVIPAVIDGSYPDNFPPALRFEVTADGTITDRPVTILGPDLREGADGRQLGIAKIVAGLLGVGTDEIARRAEQETRRRRRRIQAMLAALLLVAAGIGWLAMTNRLRPDVILQAVYDPIRLQPVFWKVQASPLSPAAEKALQPKDRFRECNLCPEMTVIPAGRFWMGRDGGFKAEAPRHEVEIPRHLAVSLGVIGIDQWDACHAHGVCFASTRLFRGTNDAATLSWHEIAGQYLRWLSQVTGKRYRLLSEAEWEYAMLGGNDGRIEPSQPHPFKLRKNGFGLDEVRGYEWVQDCWHDSYADKPAQLSATGGAWEGQCRERVIRTMKYDPNPGSLVEASPARSRMHFGSRQNFIRFRVARDMDR